MEITKTVKLNILKPTKTKREEIKVLIDTYKSALVYVIEHSDKSMSRYDIHAKLYKTIREEYGLKSQTVVELFKDAVVILNNGGTVGRVSVPFNIPRSGKFATTNNNNPVISFAGMDGRVVIPIQMDGAYDRFVSHINEGWTSPYFKFNGSNIFVTIKKEFTIPDEYDTVLGIDMGVEKLASISVINREGKVLRQLYFGVDVGHKKRDISIRRSKLKSYANKGDRYAKQSLRRLREYEVNYTKTRCYQVAHEIINVAKEFNSFIAFEDLKHLNKAKGCRRSNRKTKRMPYAIFRVALETVAGENNIMVSMVDPAYTSQTCCRCGHRGNRNSALFKCTNCGYEANADRNASVNIAIRAGCEFHSKSFFKAQTPDSSLSVNTGVFVHDGIDARCLQHLQSSPRQAPSFRGS